MLVSKGWHAADQDGSGTLEQDNLDHFSIATVLQEDHCPLAARGGNLELP